MSPPFPALPPVRRRHRLTAVTLFAALILLAPAVLRADPASDLAEARRLERLEQWTPVESLASGALERLRATPRPDSLQIAEAWYLLGVARWRTVGYRDSLGRTAATRALRIRSRRPGRDSLGVAEAHLLVAHLLTGSDRADSALIHIRRALGIRSRHLAPDDTRVADTWDQLAVTQRNEGDFQACLDSWNRAIAIRERAQGHESPEVARLLGQTGVPYMVMGDLDRARAVLQESLELFARTQGPDALGRWIPLNILADVEGRSGNWARDVDLLQEALRVVRLNSPPGTRQELTLMSNLSVALNALGDANGERAIETALLPKLEAQYGASSPRTLVIRHGLALSSRMAGDTATSLRLMREVEADLRSRPGGPGPQLSLVLGHEALMLFQEGHDAEARRIMKEVLDIERAANPLRPATLAAACGQQLRFLEETPDTAVVARELAELVRVGKEHGLTSTDRGAEYEYDAARAERKLGRGDEAWRRALEAERLAREQMRINLESFPDRRALQLARVEQRYLEFVVLLARDGGPERLATAWDRLVRTRGEVREELARRRPAAGFEADTALTNAHERWMTAQRRLARQLVASGGVARDEATRAGLRALRERSEEAESRYARMLADRGAAAPPREAGLEDVRSRLSPGQALVGFYRSRRTTGRWLQLAGRDTSDLFAFIARGSGPVAEVELGTSLDLHAAIDPWLERLATSPGPSARRGDPAERACREAGQRARAAIWDRIAPQLAGATDVFLVADDPLLDLPWQALPEGKDRYLVESGPRLHVLNSERELTDPDVAPRSGALLAVGAPDFDHGATGGTPVMLAAQVRSAPDPCAAARYHSLAPLPGSGAEAEDVAVLWRSSGQGEATVLTGPEATESEFKRDAPGRAVIHLATHGVVTSDTCSAEVPGLRGVGGVDVLPAAADGRRPADAPAARPAAASRSEIRTPWLGRRVWLALAGANQAGRHRGDENEGYLTAEEVMTLDLRGTDWVVLSACHSGLAEAWSRDGTLGMRRAFDLAGARTVIASHWSVEDEATREWMRALYEARAHGAPDAAAALESASRAVLAARRKSGRSTHPFYWAAFSASGE